MVFEYYDTMHGPSAQCYTHLPLTPRCNAPLAPCPPPPQALLALGAGSGMCALLSSSLRRQRDLAAQLAASTARLGEAEVGTRGQGSGAGGPRAWRGAGWVS